MDEITAPKNMICGKPNDESGRNFKTSSSRQAVAILGVEDIKLSDFGYEVLKRVEDGSISYKQAKEEILSRARTTAVIAKK